MTKVPLVLVPSGVNETNDVNELVSIAPDASITSNVYAIGHKVEGAVTVPQLQLLAVEGKVPIEIVSVFET